ncbi:MAG: hypothetical protein LBM16_03855 [Clostridiales bacterium]|jgi:hypothetical protein|nr:hypothetical protein [Clostridiales bacterium]
MDMEKSKTIIIVLLLGLNIILFVLFLYTKSEALLSAQQVGKIEKTLELNGIQLNAKTITNFSDMRTIELIAPENLEETASVLFFDKEGDAEGKTLTVLENSFLFENPLGTGTIALTEKSIKKKCDQEIKKIGNFFKLNGSLVFDGIYFDGGEYAVEYRLKYGKVLLYPVFVRFTVNENGIIRVRGELAQVAGFSGDERPIYSSDEVLFNLMYVLKNDFGVQDEIKIEKLDIVYYSGDTITTESVYSATPYYRIYISINEENIANFPYLVNAYTNTIIY